MVWAGLGAGPGPSSRRKGWQRTAAGCGWFRLWLRRQWHCPAASLTRCWSATATCCAKDRERECRSRGLFFFFSITFVFLLLELRRLFGHSGPRGCRDGARLESLAGRRGGRAGSLRGTLGRLGWRGGGGAVSPCRRREEVSGAKRR